MACDGYTETAMMGNWYEERLAVPQPYRKNLDAREMREEEEAISYVTRNDLLKPLGRVKRVLPWNTSAVIADDGFREFRTMNKTAMDPMLLNNYKKYQDCRPLAKTVQENKAYPENQTSIQTNQSKTFAVINETNMQKYATEIKRHVKMNITDFGSTFKTHGPDHERLFHLTTYQRNFDRPQNPTVEDVIRDEGAKLISFAGTNVRPEHLQGIKMTSPLVGEAYKTQKDPQQNTQVQRSWLPYVENAIKAADTNLLKTQSLNATNNIKATNRMTNYKATNSQLLPHDIATSLPVADGMHTIKSKYMEPNAFRRIRSDVTLIRNKPLTKK